jgi:hypothetical protein
MQVKRIKLLFFFYLFLSFISRVSAQTLGTDDSPPRLRDLEGLAVQMLYFAWGLAGLIFTVLLIIIGARYMTSAGDQQKQQALKEKGKNWVLGLILFFLAYPIVLTFYSVTGIGQTGSSCYKDITTPGFHFFFPSVCTDPNAEGSNSYGSACEAGENLGSDQKCCYISSVKIIMPVNAGIKILPNGGVYTFTKNAGDSTCVMDVAARCIVGNPGCSCSYTYDPHPASGNDSDKLKSECKP